MTSTPTLTMLDAGGLFPGHSTSGSWASNRTPIRPRCRSWWCPASAAPTGGSTAAEAATGRPASWSSTQLVATAAIGERVRLDVDVVASGRTVEQVQVQVRGTVDERLVFAAVGSTATPQAGGIAGLGQTMSRVPPPEDCPRWAGLRGAGSPHAWTGARRSATTP